MSREGSASGRSAFQSKSSHAVVGSGVEVFWLDVGRYVGDPGRPIPHDVARSVMPCDRARVDRLARHPDRVRSVFSRHLLRTVLSRRLACGPHDLTLGRDEAGKPFAHLDGKPAPHFNLSHAGRYVVVAVACCPVGVDVEEIRPTADLADVARDHFSADERAWLSGDPAGRFFALWTRKEALLKAMGHGLGVDTTRLVVIPGPDRAGDWLIRSLDLLEGHALAVAWREAPRASARRGWARATAPA